MRRILFMAAMAASLAFVPAARAQDIADPNDIVYHWYRAYFDRTPDPSGASYWADQLSRGKDPNTVLAALLGSDEYFERAGSRPDGFVGKLFVDLLGRAPTAGEVDRWVRRLYTDSRQDVAYQILTQNAGSWVGTYRLPERDRARWYRDRDHDRDREELLRRERERERERERDRYDYRRPVPPYRH
jgi:Domain of unknown function (DUF4214)